jgi:hypothetical protein
LIEFVASGELQTFGRVPSQVVAKKLWWVAQINVHQKVDLASGPIREGGIEPVEIAASHMRVMRRPAFVELKRMRDEICSAKAIL